jgi:biotin transport system substrate-specific component
MATIQPLAGGAVRPRPRSILAREAALLVAASVFLALTARISVPLPFSPVPISGQTLGVMLIGALYGPRRGTLAVALSIVEGAAGLPVFAAGRSGIAVLLGPTGGYIAGFLPAAAVAGLLCGSARPVGVRFAGALLAGLAVYLCGVPWLMAVTAMPLGPAVVQGLLPFLPGDALKAAIVAGVVPAGATLLARWGVRPF